jgi:hypothetical protein
MNPNVLKAVAVVAELTGTELSAHALKAIGEDLATYPESAVLTALARCRRELTGRLTLSAIIERINDSDGRPSADEAWALALEALDEAKTVVWCEEIQQAFAIARPVLQDGDKIGARMAFKNAYDRIVKEAREECRPAQWSASLGWDQGHRQSVLTKAVELGMLQHSQVAGLLPAPKDIGIIGALLLGDKSGGPIDDSEESKETVRRCGEILANLAASRANRMSIADELADRARKDLADRKAKAAAMVADRLGEVA